MKNFKLESGFTLLELLASIVILVIVLTSFFAFFTQSAKFTKKNEDGLVAMNLAREVLEAVKKDSSEFPYSDRCYEDKEKDGLYPCLTFSEELTTDGEKVGNLLRVTITIHLLENDQLLAKTYGYVRRTP